MGSQKPMTDRPNTMPQMPAENRENDPASQEAERAARFRDEQYESDQEPDTNGPNNKRNKNNNN